MSSDRYPFRETEEKWREWWKAQGVHEVDLDTPSDRKKYILVMFSYPSASKLHIGHWWNYGPTDTYARFLRMNGFHVFEPMGFDSFGLPAEAYAIKVGSHPKEVTETSIAYIQEQLEAIGAMYDWRFRVITSRPEYYKWTQWLFLQLYKNGLAVQKDGYVNWDPIAQTVLANEQVVNGISERSGAAVVQRKMKQWYFRITEYADKLLEGLQDLDWPESTIKRQQNWIGRSVGANIRFPVTGQEEQSIDVFTTRPDTIYGVTYVVLAPEHDLVNELTTDENREEVQAYVTQAGRATEVERTSTTREKTGVFTGAYVTHPLSGEKLPVWVADYVLATYGTGAVMAVPAHDQRDFEFAIAQGLPMKVVIRPRNSSLDVEEMREAFEEPGIMMDSETFSGLRSEDGKKVVAEKLEERGLGGPRVTYRLRDWSISRQRYWGCPIPVVHCEQCGVVPVPEDQLPVELPEEIEEYRPKGTSPLGALDEWMNTSCPDCGGPARRDPDTMDTFVDSSYYHLRYLAANDDTQPFNRERMEQWLPIDVYVGGPEHGTGHLIYFRFITRFLHELGWVPEPEPAKKLIHQGIITHAGQRMSKSKGNVVNPDVFVDEYGSDVFRMYLMFMGDYREGGDWSDEGITGIDRFINRIWRLVEQAGEGSMPDGDPRKEDYSDALYRTLHQAIASVSEDLHHFGFNTAISRMMELVNETYRWAGDDQALHRSDAMKRLLRILALLVAPFAPHFGEEIWHRLGGTGTVFDQIWPVHDPDALVTKTITLVVQVNGKVRDKLEAPVDADEEALKELAISSEKVQVAMRGKTLRKAVVVPGKLVNLVVA
ncbi:leucine--tRNA ligase [bacterium]|nr:leucine--tRNA ligase [bacterium]